MTDETTINDDVETQQGEEQPTTENQTAVNDESTDEKKEVDSEEQQKNEKQRNKTREYIERLRSSAHEERQQRRALEQKLAELERRLPPPPEERQPTLEDVNGDPTAYIERLAEWKAREALNQYQQQLHEQIQTHQQAEIVNDFSRRCQEFSQQHDDFEDAITSIPSELMPQELANAIVALPNGPEVAYALAHDEEALFNIASMRPELMTRAVQRYAARAGSATPDSIPVTAQTTKPITKAPSPPPKLGGRGVSADVDEEKLTDDEWYRRQQAKRKR